MIICLFILLGQATHLFWHDEPFERLSHKIVQLSQAVGQLNQRTAVVAALRLQWQVDNFKISEIFPR